jgi:hypothetical protein
MKKYKLIKEYPDSPTLGYIIKNHSTLMNIFYWNNTVIDPRRWPSYWQEIIPEAYRVIAWHQPGCRDFTSGIMPTWEWPEYTVERTSDGVRFTLGDRVRMDDSEYTFTIDKFNIANGKMYARSDNNVCDWHIDKLSHHKKYLFTSEDMKLVHEDDEVWEITKDFQLLHIKKCGKGYTSHPEVHIFKDKVKAKQYSVSHKPIYSLTELCDLLDLVTESTELIDELLIKIKK